MPPRHNYWTILFGDKPTAFRAATEEELLPTFKQIQAKHADAVMMWFARGKLWRSEEDARAAFERPRFDRPGPRPSAFARKPTGPGYGETPPKPGGRGGESDNRAPRPEWRDRPRGPRPEWKDKPRDPRPDWKDKPRFDRPPGPPKPAWQNRGPKPEWRDKSRDDRPRGPRPEWKDKPRFDRPPGSPKSRSDEGPPKPRSGEGGQNRGPKPPWRDKPRDDRPRDPNAPRPEWRDKPRGPKPSAFARKPSGPGYGETPPKPAGRGGDWRPGGAHKDPRDRFKVPRDVKRARFKDKLRRDRSSPPPPRKKKDEE